MYLRDIMTTDVITLPSKTHIIEARRIMEAKKKHRIPVVDRGKLVGMITKGRLEKAFPSEPNPHDLFKFSYNIASLYGKPIRDIMRRDVVTAKPNMTVEEAVALAQVKKVGALVVTKDKQVVGIVTTNDFFYKILNKVLGVGASGSRLEITKGGEGKALEEIISCLNKADIDITALHIHKRPGKIKKNVVIHVDSEKIEQCVTELKNKGYKVSLRKR